MQALKNVRILDASHVIAGPFASYQLALLGASVTRIDRIDGSDFVRHLGGTDAMKKAGLGASFMSQNAGKACIQLNLKDPRGVEIFKKLAADADVVIENFRPGILTRLGLGYEHIRSIQPDIIYCSLTGYGPAGPMADAPAYDHILQGHSGLMSTTGTPETGPLRVGLPITDYIAGLNAAFAIVNALYHRKITGEGQHLQVSMLASILSTMGAALVDHQTTGELPAPKGNQPFSGSPFAGRFDTAEGQLVVTANTAQQTINLLQVLGLTNLDEHRLAVDNHRSLTPAEREKALTTLTTAFQKRTAIEWENALSAASVPASKVRHYDEILAHEQTRHIGALHEMPNPVDGGTLNVPGLGFYVGQPSPVDLVAPEKAGQSTKRILLNASYNIDQLRTLAREGVISGEGLD